MTEWISDKWCLYKHTSPSGKVYVGITNNTKNRWRTGGIGYKTQTVFWRAITKYGWDSFQHEILETDLPVEEAKRKEIELIKELKSNNPKYGYNQTYGGDIMPDGAFSPESVAKARATKQAKKEAGIRTARYGMKYSPEFRKKLSEAHIGIQAGENHPMYGKHHSDETKEKLRQANLGKKLSEETRKKISERAKGKQAGLFHPMYGKHLSDEHKQKVSEGLKRGNHPHHGLKGKDHPHYGFKHSEYSKEKMRHTSRNIAVLQYTVDGNFVREWESLTEIQR